MSRVLQRILERLDRQKVELVRRIETWPQPWLTHKPAETEWSALQVLEHLRKTELSVLHSCEKNLKLRTHTVTAFERMRAQALIAMMRLPVKVKIPEPVSFVRPEHVTSLHTVLDSWSAERQLLRTFFELRTIDEWDVGVVFHPAAGWMNLRGSLRFLSVHFRHHEYQLDRIKASAQKAEFPASRQSYPRT